MGLIPLLLSQFEEILKKMIYHDLIDVVNWSNIFLLLEDKSDATRLASGFESERRAFSKSSRFVSGMMILVEGDFFFQLRVKTAQQVCIYAFLFSTKT